MHVIKVNLLKDLSIYSALRTISFSQVHLQSLDPKLIYFTLDRGEIKAEKDPAKPVQISIQEPGTPGLTITSLALTA